MYNQSFWGSYQNARRLRNSEEIAANDNDSGIAMDQALRAQQGQAVAGGIITGLTGATTLLSNAFKDAQIRDTSMQENQIDINYQDIRGMTTGQKFGSVGTSMLSGAATGLQIGGPWGALAGLAVGGLTGIGGVLAGDSAARTRQESLNIQAQLAGDAAQQNFAAAHERIGDNIHRQNAVNAVAEGGPIHRMIDDTLLKKPRQKEYRCGGKVQKLYCNGGVKIRIKK